jgi:hypothetical protein
LLFEELGPSRAQEEERGRDAPVEEVLEELQQGLVRPVEVLDDEDRRSACGQGLEEATPGGERLLLRRSRAVARRPDEGSEARLEPRPLGVVLEERSDRVAELGRGNLAVVRLEDPRLRLHDLPERPEGDALAVGEAAPVPPGDELRPIVEGASELSDEAALPNAGLANDRDELNRALALGTEERLMEEVALELAPDERCLGRRLRLADATSCLDRAPRCDRLGLPLRGYRFEPLVRDRTVGRAHRRLVHGNPADRGCTLETSRGVHDITRHQPLATLGPRSESHDCLAGGHRGANCDIEPARAKVVDRLQDAKCRPYSPLGVVLVSCGSAEDRHHRVADELLDGAAEALNVGLHPLVVGAQRRAHVFRIRSVGAAGESHEVDEEYGHDLALFGGRRLSVERMPAREAEARACSGFSSPQTGQTIMRRIFAAPSIPVYVPVATSSLRRRRKRLVVLGGLLVLGETALQHAA